MPLPSGFVIDTAASIPLSYSQRRLWFLSQMEGGSGAYHICGGLRLHGDLNAVALRGALDRIVFRHEVLRSRIEQMDGEPVQRVGEGGFALVEQTGSEAEAELWRDEESRTLFDLGRGPLIRGRLVRHGERDHTLLLTMHHIVSDGWSMGVLTRELELLYAAFRAGLADPLPPLPVQYGDYAVWQRRRMAGAALELQAGYWKQALAGAPALLDLPLDRPRPASQSYAGAFAPVELDRALGAALRGLARQHDTTLFMVLLAGWAVLLGRLSGQQDVVIGTPVANRTRAELEHLIGFFVNTLPLRLDLSGSPSVGDLLAQTRRCVLEGQQHQDIPFEQMVEAIGPPRSLAHSPVFQTMFAWQNGGGPALQFAGLEVHGVAAAEHRVSKFDLSLSLEEAADGAIRGGIEYATALFEPETVTRWLGYYKRLLEAMAAGSQQPVDRLPMLSAAEREQVLYGWNGARRGAAEPILGPRLEPICVHRLFEAQAARTPEAEAVVYAGASLNYAELNRRANRLAHWLREQGVGPDIRVGLCLERGLEMVVSLLAVLKAGGAYVPLDPRYPAARLRFMLEDSDPRLVLSSLSLLPLLGDQAGTQVRTVALDDDNDHDHNGNGTNGNGNHNANGNRPWDRQPDTNPDNPELTPKHLAYIIYTSGSTGTPKGVMVPHHGLVNRFLWMYAQYPFDKSEICCARASINFVDSVWEILGPLSKGIQTIVVADDVSSDPVRLAKILEQHSITRLVLVPSLLRTLTDAHVSGLISLPRLKYWFCSGQELQQILASEFLSLDRGALINLYGSSEDSADVTFFEAQAVNYSKSVPIGWPIDNTQIYLLDLKSEPVPIGVTGELYVGGDSPARGYHNLQALTADRFVPDPFSETPGCRLFKTGDLARYSKDGKLIYIGRNDAQTKIRGVRIDPGEIEVKLVELSGAAEAVVVCREDIPGDERLVAYYKAASPISAHHLRARLISALPRHMVPSAFVHVSEFPFKPNGKVDRLGFSAPGADAYARSSFDPPQGDTEILLAKVWSEVLRTECIGREDNFFELGGHSMLILSVVSLLKRSACEISPSWIFSYPTVKALSEKIISEAGRYDADRAICIRKGDRARPPLFLTHDGMGELLYAHILSDHIDSAFSIYGLPPNRHEDPPIRTIEGVAARMVTLIREVQPTGPYHLAGWCYGGLYAYEIAAQLIGDGEEVSYLGMFNTRYAFGVTDDEKQILEDDDLIDQLLFLIEYDGQIEDSEKNALLSIKATAKSMNYKAVMQCCRDRGLRPKRYPDLNAEELKQHLTRANLLHVAAMRYAIQALPIPVHLFAADERHPVDAAPSWDGIIPSSQLRTISVPGSHSSMMTAPHIEILGAALTSSIQAATGPPVDIRARHSPRLSLWKGRPDDIALFCIPGAGASVTSLVDLISCFHKDWNVYGLQPQGFDGLHVPYSTISQAVRRYLASIREVKPHGPIHLLGHSFGGWIAFEMALQLSRAGGEVASLTILDSDAPGYNNVREYNNTEALLKWIAVFEEMLESPLGITGTDLDVRDHMDQLRLIHSALIRCGLLSPLTKPDDLAGPFRAFASSIRVHYIPSGVHTGPMQLLLVNSSRFRLDRSGDDRNSETTRWQKWASNLQIGAIAGNHMTALKLPHAARNAIAICEGIEAMSSTPCQ